MKTWMKIGIVFLSGGMVWTFSFLIGQNPELAQVLGALNVAVIGGCSYLTGFTKES